jgi:hypothetical protein
VHRTVPGNTPMAGRRHTGSWKGEHRQTTATMAVVRTLLR